MNDDGFIDFQFGPEQPGDAPESNRPGTVPAEGPRIIVRLFGTRHWAGRC